MDRKRKMLLLMVFKLVLKIKWNMTSEEIVFLNEKKMIYVFISVTYLVT